MPPINNVSSCMAIEDQHHTYSMDEDLHHICLTIMETNNSLAEACKCITYHSLVKEIISMHSSIVKSCKYIFPKKQENVTRVPNSWFILGLSINILANDLLCSINTAHKNICEHKLVCQHYNIHLHCTCQVMSTFYKWTNHAIE